MSGAPTRRALSSVRGVALASKASVCATQGLGGSIASRSGALAMWSSAVPTASASRHALLTKIAARFHSASASKASMAQRVMLGSSQTALSVVLVAVCATKI